MPNRLANATSPYLRQHRDNPVEWYPWGEEAFTRALLEDKPVFVSIGYASCHWCHVMAHESFEDAEVAAILNRYFVNVKVDREERPDVDEAYMAAVQLSTGRGGWPLSVFCTPQKRPFFGGTYFPKEDRGGSQPGFKTILRSLAQTWVERRADIEKASAEYEAALRQTLGQRAPDTDAPLSHELFDAAVAALAGDYDDERGGFGEAPKFPPHTAIDFLLAYAMSERAPDELRQAAVVMSVCTLEAICLGGLHDHVGGGFHRYATDREWLLPHFEKTLYDNALMLANLSSASALVGRDLPRQVALFRRATVRLVEWLEREMSSSEGLFYSALDADSEGEEGKFYTWTGDEARSVLGSGADAFLTAYRFAPEGNFEDEVSRKRTGRNIPHLAADDHGAHELALMNLQEARERRIRPGLDDKALVGWNGLAIQGLVRAGRADRAVRCADALLRYELRHGELPHQIANETPSGAAFLEDYAHLAHGLFELSAVTADERWEREAVRLTATMIERFYDGRDGAFFGTTERHERLFGRTKPVLDQPTPSGNAAAIACTLFAGDRPRAERSLRSLLGWMARAPQATESLLLTAFTFVVMSEAEPRFDPGTPIATAPEHAAAPVPATAQAAVTLERREVAVGPDGWAENTLLLSIPEGLHLVANPAPDRWSKPTKLSIEPVRYEASYPEGTNGRYVGDVRVPFRVALDAGESGADYEVEVELQECTESECQAPRRVRLSGVVYRP